MISSPLRFLSGLTAVALLAAAPHVTESAPQLDVAAFAATDGEERWRLAVTGCVRSLGHAPDMLFAGVQEGTVYVFR